MRLWTMCPIVALFAGCVLAREGTGVDGDKPTTTTATGTGGAGGETAGAGGATSGSTSTTSAGSGGAPAESDCLNGDDDDGDGAYDCEDPDCSDAGYSCLPALPGALGQVVVGAAECPAATVPTALRRCDANDCSCVAGLGTCSFTVERWNGNNCNGSPTSSTKTMPGCYVTDYTVASSFMGTTTPQGGSSCAASSPTTTALDVGACEVLGGSCAGGGACVPPSVLPAQACVLLPAGSSCSAPYDGYSETVYANAGATCDCACGKSAPTCVGTFSAHQGYPNVCVPPATDIPFDATCHSVGDTDSYLIEAPVEVSQCAATASMASGEAVLCCTQPPS